MCAAYFWLTEAQFERLRPLLPTDTRGVARVDDRRVISGIVHVLKSGCRWKDAPAVYGPHKTLYNRFVRWARKGVWERVFRELAEAGGPPEALMLDSTHVKAHRCAAGGKGGTPRKESDAHAVDGPVSSTSPSTSRVGPGACSFARASAATRRSQMSW